MTLRPARPDDVVAALLSEHPLAALDALQLTDPVLQQVRDAARARLSATPPSTAARRLLAVVSRFPGLSRAELAEHVDLPDAALAAAAQELLDKGLATSTRFGRGDCWSRTAAGAAVLRSR